jgi:tetratricopeptide (TPR) repeat protein
VTIRRPVTTYEIVSLQTQIDTRNPAEIPVINSAGEPTDGPVMVNAHSDSENISEVDTALLDAELFLKYQAPEKAINRLRTALELSPRSIPLRERLREVAVKHKNAAEAARQCLALASLYIERDDFDDAYDRLLEAKELDPRINIAGGLEAIRRARRPELSPVATSTESAFEKRFATLAGDLTAISVFDAVQVIENAKLTGYLELTGEQKSGAQKLGEQKSGRVMFNDGRIVDAESAGEKGEAGFRKIVEISTGSFEFHKSPQAYPVVIKAPSNTNLILDTLRQLDEASAGE